MENSDYVYQIELEKEDVHLLLKALNVYKERWSGGDPSEQMHIDYLIIEFQRMSLDSLFDLDSEA